MPEHESSKLKPGALLEIENVGVSFGRTRVLEGINATIKPGTFFTLLGASGSGKSTLLNSIAGFVTPQEGTIKLNNKILNTVPIHKRNIGMVFQSYALFPNLSVADNIAYPMRLRGKPKAEIDAAVADALAFVRMEGFGNRDTAALSGGQRQRIALARAIVFEPDILIMDEPLSALDKKLRDDMQIELRRLHDRLGLTTIYVTHDQREAMTLSDEIAILEKGRIAQIAPPQDLYNHPSSAYVASFMGESNLLRVTRRADGGFALNDTPIQSDHCPNIEQAWLCARPEKLVVSPKPGEADTVFDARLVDKVFQGESWLLECQLDDATPITVRAADHGGSIVSQVAPGQRLQLGLSRRDTYFIERTEGAHS